MRPATAAPGPWSVSRKRPWLGAAVLGLHVALGAALAAAGGGRGAASEASAPRSWLVTVRLLASEPARVAAPMAAAAAQAAALPVVHRTSPATPLAPAASPAAEPVSSVPVERAAEPAAEPTVTAGAPHAAETAAAPMREPTTAATSAATSTAPATEPAAIGSTAATSPTAPAPAPWVPAHRAECTAAPHPLVLRERGIEGVVQLRVQVGSDGRARAVQVQASSGFRLFDEAAMRQARSCSYRPALQDGAPVDSWVEYPVRFALAG